MHAYFTTTLVYGIKKFFTLVLFPKIINVKKLKLVGILVQCLSVVSKMETLLVINAGITYCGYFSIVTAGEELQPSTHYVYKKLQLAVKV